MALNCISLNSHVMNVVISQVVGSVSLGIVIITQISCLLQVDNCNKFDFMRIFCVPILSLLSSLLLWILTCHVYSSAILMEPTAAKNLQFHSVDCHN